MDSRDVGKCGQPNIPMNPEVIALLAFTLAAAYALLVFTQIKRMH